MKKLLKLLGVLLAAALVTIGLNGCAVAALTAASAYAASSGDDDTAAYHKNNTEREKAGLRPLSEEEWEKRNAVKTKKNPSRTSGNTTPRDADMRMGRGRSEGAKSSPPKSSKQEPSSAIPKR